MAISLTQGMRSNLYSLQSTAKLMQTTQERLSTGKKVNSALDSPTSYFTAKNHMERANGLASYKDGMSEAVQAIKAADAGIEAITALIDSAIAVAQKAKDSDAASEYSTVRIDLSDVDVGDKITIGGEVYTASATAENNGFLKGGTDAETAINLAALINSTSEATTDIDVVDVQGTSLFLEVDTADADLALSDVDIATADEDNFSKTLLAGSDEISQLVTQYGNLMTQLDDLVDDSNYKGTNLLKSGGGYNLTVDFSDSASLTLQGFDASASTGLSLATTATSSWASNTNCDTDITALEAAKDLLQVQASNLANNLSTITARQTFTESMIQTLETGADNLTLADMNEESANMLMLQTQQSLGVNSLSLSAQSAQSVLRLF